MPSPLNIGTRDVPLKLAKEITRLAEDSFESGEMFTKTSPITADLLKFWFCEPHTTTRNINFHDGQKQAILNTVYLHEVLETDSVKKIYEEAAPDFLPEIDLAELSKDKYSIPKYAIKMATGTGKTWVMHALVIWQFLNAKYEENKSGKYSNNFLLIAPGIIVYERLLDAYMGKLNENGVRDFEKSDFAKFEGLFIPPTYKDEIFGFIQNNTVQKEEIGSKVTGEGLIAIANWHLFMDGSDKGVEGTPLDSPESIVKNILPITPGVSGGNALDSLDSAYLRGGEVEYLAKLDDLVCINDEAHHIHENKSYGEVKEVEWQKSLNRIARGKGRKFMQIDFSATPYDVSGSGQKRIKHYFPHVIVDFDLKSAIRRGFVKAIAIDKRKEIVDLPLEFTAIRENNKVVGLSDGQKLMLRAGLVKLKFLEDKFVEFTKDSEGVSNKYPKMMVMCEDTNVAPFVTEFLRDEGLSEEDVMQIDSGKKEFLGEKDWQAVKQRLFSVDEHSKPKVIVSVLMLREGFDVNNICVIIPLRAAAAPILLEQTIGRGLRLMWREPEYQDIKKENLMRLIVEKKEPNSYLDLLTIIEHPAFVQFYDDLLAEGLATEIERDPGDGNPLGDLIKVGLKENYKKYDMHWVNIISDSEEELEPKEVDISKLEPFTIYKLEDMKKFFAKDGERFISEEILVKTRFGEYSVNASLFNSQSYNEYLEKTLNTVVNRMAKVSQRKSKSFPTMQINNIALLKALDNYIRKGLFNQDFDPFIDNNWKVLLLKNGIVTQHIIKEVGKVIFELQSSVKTSEAKVHKSYFSEIPELKMREEYSLDITKTIYERLPFPSNRGGFEKDFLLYADGDSEVESIMKVNEYYHNYANITYIRTDGFLSLYYPDFLVKTSDKVYVIETKSDRDLKDENVKQKQIATLDWIKRVNELSSDERMDKEWVYVLLGETHFRTLKDNNASINEICELAKITESNITGKLF